MTVEAQSCSVIPKHGLMYICPLIMNFLPALIEGLISSNGHPDLITHSGVTINKLFCKLYYSKYSQICCTGTNLCSKLRSSSKIVNTLLRVVFSTLFSVVDL